MRRSPYQALAAVAIMTLTFLAVSVFAFLILGSSQIINYFESKPQVTAFFHDEAKQSEMDGLIGQLKANPNVASVKFVSKQEALKIYQQQNKSDPLLLDLVTADILPASVEISTNNIEDLPAISDTVQKNPIVQEVVFQKDVVATLTTWTNALRVMGLSLIIILSAVSIFIMTTIIGIKISQKREEIEVMQLIGASRAYISWPFLFEGISYGLIGTFIGWLVSSIALLAITPFLEEFLRGIPVLPVPWYVFVILLFGEFILAILLGALASTLAVRRYIK